jgi:hypothetical protein
MQVLVNNECADTPTFGTPRPQTAVNNSRQPGATKTIPNANNITDGTVCRFDTPISTAEETA